MGCDERHFNVSLIVRGKVTRQCTHITTLEENWEPKKLNTIFIQMRAYFFYIYLLRCYVYRISELNANLLGATQENWFTDRFSVLDANMLRTTHRYHGFRDHIDCTKFVKCTIWFVGHISELGANVFVNSTHSVSSLVDKILETYCTTGLGTIGARCKCTWVVQCTAPLVWTTPQSLMQMYPVQCSTIHKQERRKELHFF